MIKQSGLVWFIKPWYQCGVLLSRFLDKGGGGFTFSNVRAPLNTSVWLWHNKSCHLRDGVFSFSVSFPPFSSPLLFSFFVVWNHSRTWMWFQCQEAISLSACSPCFGRGWGCVCVCVCLGGGSVTDPLGLIL